MATKKIKGLPVYEAKLTDGGCRILRVSLVESPAVEVDFKAYESETRPQLYKVIDEDKRRVFGVVLRADYMIYREDSNGAGYWITFGADTIREFAQKYLAEGRQNEVDLDHDFRSIEGAQMVQYFLKDTAGGVSPIGFEDVKDGSLFAEYQITDENLWQSVKEGSYKGFSVEIIHDDVPVQYNQTPIQMSKMEKIKSLLAAMLAEVESAEEPTQAYGEVSTDKGVIRWDGDEDLKEGTPVYGVDADGNRVDIEDGEYVLEGKIVVIAGGKVAELKDKEVAEEKPAEAPKPEAQEEEKPAESEGEDIEALKARISELEGALEAAKAENEELKAKLNAPAGEPAHQAFKKIAYSAENPLEECKKYFR